MNRTELTMDQMEAVVGGVVPKNYNPDTKELSAPPKEEDTISKCIAGVERAWNAVVEMVYKCWPF